MKERIVANAETSRWFAMALALNATPVGQLLGAAKTCWTNSIKTPKSDNRT
jgi:hypothetical protein